MKMRSAYCGLMPMPLSLTEKIHSPGTMASRYVDFGRLFAAELDCIAYQVLKELRHLC